MTILYNTHTPISVPVLEMDRKCIVWVAVCVAVMQLAGYVFYVHCSSRCPCNIPDYSSNENRIIYSSKIPKDRLQEKKTVGKRYVKKDAHILLAQTSTTLSPPHKANSSTSTRRGYVAKKMTTQIQIRNGANISLIEEVTTLLRKQLELNTTTPKHSITIKCNPKPTWNHACVRPNCSQLSNDTSKRVKSLFSEKNVLTKAQDDLLRSIAAQIPETDVILMTATSSNHFDEVQAMFHTLHNVVTPELAKHENYSIVFWDIGLSPTQRIQMEKCCRCQVVTFPFDKFPSILKDLRCYMWKPLIIRMTQLRARKFVVWQDASIRFLHYPGAIYETGMQQGLQLLSQKIGVSVPHRTLPETFAYFGQEVCNFSPFPEIASGFGVYKNDPFVLKAVTNPWARCGLEQTCMCPKNSYASYRCEYGPCHRFDQSALSIITDTLYSSEVYRVMLVDTQNFFDVKRNDKESNYFNSTGCLSK